LDRTPFFVDGSLHCLQSDELYYDVYERGKRLKCVEDFDFDEVVGIAHLTISIHRVAFNPIEAPCFRIIGT